MTPVVQTATTAAPNLFDVAATAAEPAPNNTTSGLVQRFDIETFESLGVPILAQPDLGYAKANAATMRLAVTGESDSLRVYDLGTGLQLGSDLPFAGGSNRFEFTADGSILSVPREGAIDLRNFDTDTWVEIACEFAGRNLTQDEWDQLGPRTAERRATCPQYRL